jgi:hypothetical protein
MQRRQHGGQVGLPSIESTAAVVRHQTAWCVVRAGTVRPHPAMREVRVLWRPELREKSLAALC